MHFTQVKEISLYVHDLDKIEAFYHGLLEMPVISRVEGRHIFFRAGSSVLLCFIAEATRQEEELPPHYAEGKQHIAFECPLEEYEAWKQKLMKAGIAITHEADWRGKFKSFYFDDPEGNVLEIVQPGMWDPA